MASTLRLNIKWWWQKRVKGDKIERALIGKGRQLIDRYAAAHQNYLQEERKDKPDFSKLERYRITMEVLKWLIGE